MNGVINNESTRILDAFESKAFRLPRPEIDNVPVESETLRIMQERLHESIVASRHLIISEDDSRKIHLVGVKFHELWKIADEYMYYVECGFLVIESYSQMFVVEAKNAYLVDEYTKFGSISAMELIGKVQEADIFEDFQIAYKRMRGV